jgi:hypothetical protein
VLDENRDEALERAVESPVDDEDRVLGVVRPHEREPEPGRHLLVELDRPKLPGPSERVRHVQVDLGPVERPFTLADDVGNPVALQRRMDLGLGEVPLLVAAELVVGAG